MITNFPYISGDYYSEKYKPFELKLTLETISKTEILQFRNEIEYIYVCEGKGKIEVNGAKISIENGNFIQLMPYHVHRFIFFGDETIKIYRIRFSMGLLLYTSTNKKNYLNSIQTLENVLPVVYLNERFQRRLLFICEETMFDIKERRSDLEPLYIALISFISYAYYYHHQQLKNEREQQMIGGRLLQYIQFHHQEQLTLTRLSKVFGLLESQVKEVLLKTTGFSFSQLLNQVRIRNAVALTQFNELSINQIGKICGFQSDSSFYKQFKQLENMTPESYRKMVVKKGEVRSDTFEVVLFLIDHLSDSLTIKELAAELNFSEKRINNLLEEEFNMTFQPFYNKLRVIASSHFLTNKQYNIEQVALKMGFQDRLTFSRNFEKIYEMTPFKFKKIYTS